MSLPDPNPASAILFGVRGRIAAGVAAWLPGASAATGDGMPAISLIGKRNVGRFPLNRPM
jgi:hypothetical protein